MNAFLNVHYAVKGVWVGVEKSWLAGLGKQGKRPEPTSLNQADRRSNFEAAIESRKARAQTRSHPTAATIIPWIFI